MTLTKFATEVKKSLKHNNAIILTGAATVGTLATVYLTAKASFQAAERIRIEEDGKPNENPRERFKERTKLVWKLYIPPAIAASSTIACIVGSNRVAAAKTLAAQTAYAVTERAYSEYRNKIIEDQGERKDESIRADVVADEVKKTAPAPEVMLISQANVLCCELWTGRYFPGDMESLKRAENRLNERLVRNAFCTVNEFYDFVGGSRLRYTSSSGDYGWMADRELMELKFSSVITEDGRPCLAFDYNYVEPI